MKGSLKVGVAGLGFLLAAAACSSLPGLQAISGGDESMPKATGDLAVLADAIEADADYIDVIQVGRNDSDNLVIFVMLARPEGMRDANDLVQSATEIVWQATLEVAPQTSHVTTAFVRPVDINTLDNGPSKGGWLVGSVTAGIDGIQRYFGAERNSDFRRSFWSNEVIILPIDRAYNGTPNHPFRFVENSP